MRLYLVLVLVLVIVMSGCIGQYPEETTTSTPTSTTTTLQPKKVTITTDKTEYILRENVRITVTNNLDDSVWYMKLNYFDCGFPFWILEENVNDDWQIVKLEPSCVTGGTPPPIELKPSESIKYSWNMYRYLGGWNNSNPIENYGLAEPGTYRFFFDYYSNCSKVQDYYDCKNLLDTIRVYSDEFTIVGKLGTNTTLLPKDYFCGGMGRVRCPEGYYCYIDAPPNYVHAAGVCKKK